MDKASNDIMLIGIDEAGLGPLLGPLVVSAAAFTIPAGINKESMWLLLKDAVSNHKKNLAGRMLICDSKKAYTPATGIAFLERTVLTCLKYLDKMPTSVAQLADNLCPQRSPRLRQYPWHKEIDSRKINFNADDISICAAAFAKTLAKNNMTLSSLKSFCFDTAYYNEMVRKVNNKSTVAFTAVCGLIDEIIKSSYCRNFHFVIDRQGGRTSYVRPLRTMFSDMELKILSQDPAKSSYELSTPHKIVKIDFCVKADAEHLPVCLASMASKYLREQLMGCLNDYFISKCAALKPTAGYWTDGKRFLNDIKNLAPHITYNPDMLIRSR
jgi:ribonuclease HII